MTSARKLVAAKYRRQPADVPVLLDGELAAAIETAQAAVVAAEAADKANPAGLVSDLPARKAALASLQAEADAAVTVFTLASLPGGEFTALKNAHPPSAVQWERYKTQIAAAPVLAQFISPPEFDSDAMAPLLIAGSLVAIDGEPVEWDADDGEYLWSHLHDGGRADLLEKAYELSNKTTLRPKSESGTDMTSSTAPDSTTPPVTESPSLSLAEGM